MDDVLQLFEQLPTNAYTYLHPGVIHYFPWQQESLGSGEKDGIHLLMDYTLKNFHVNSAEIICFGNNMYGKEVSNIWKFYPEIDIRLMVCSPSVDIITQHDKKTLNKKISKAIKNTNTAIFASESPPTLRSCILYENGKPVLCCVQYYMISMLEERLPSFKGRQTPCIMLYQIDNKLPMEQYVEFCESEFERLFLDNEAYYPVINEETKEVERSETKNQNPTEKKMRRFLDERRKNRVGRSLR